MKTGILLFPFNHEYIFALTSDSHVNYFVVIEIHEELKFSLICVAANLYIYTNYVYI